VVAALLVLAGAWRLQKLVTLKGPGKVRQRGDRHGVTARRQDYIEMELQPDFIPNLIVEAALQHGSIISRFEKVLISSQGTAIPFHTDAQSRHSSCSVCPPSWLETRRYGYQMPRLPAA
jgi:hypothetical protein